MSQGPAPVNPASAPAPAKTGFSDANFPATADGRTYHLMVKRGEVANRVFTAGDCGRIEKLAKKYLDVILWAHRAPREFVVITGLRHGVPLTFAASLMGYPNLDFLVRETRAVVDGTLVICRFGTCGTPNRNIRLGSMALARETRGIIRNPDEFREAHPDPERCFQITKPVAADPALFQHFERRLAPEFSSRLKVGCQMSGCSFYSSQGRIGQDFEDHNEQLLDRIEKVPDAVAIEMETFHLYDLASISRPGRKVRAIGTAMVIAERFGGAFVTPEDKERWEDEMGLASVDALVSFPIPDEELMKGPECVWVNPPTDIPPLCLRCGRKV